MKYLLTIFACAFSISLHAQTTNITVVADPSRVIRTNFTIGSAQVTGLQTALDAKLATNGSAAGLTNFPSNLLTTNGDASGLTNFPPSLLTTNGDGSGLSNLPNANLTNATGVLPIASGGTGQTNAGAAIEALLPAYTNNADKILALNSNATGLVWTTNAGGGGGTYTNAEDAMLGLFFGSTNDNGINLFVNGGTNADNQHTVIGSEARAYSTVNVDQAVVIGALAQVTNGGVAIGSDAVTANGVAVGPNASAEGSSVAFGRYADARGGTATNYTDIGSVAIGTFATAFAFEGVAIGSVSQVEDRGVAIGHSALSDGGNTNRGGIAIGYDSIVTFEGVAIGDDAVAWSGVSIGSTANSASNSIAIGNASSVNPFLGQAIQIGTGTNTNDNTIQLWSAGSVTTNTWSALANASVIGTNLLQATDTTNAQSILGLTNVATYPSFSNNAGLVLAVTTNETGVEWIAVSNTVTDASTLTNFPASILQTNSADGSFPSFLARTNADASGFTNFPTFNQNTTGTASNVTGIVQITNGGTGTNSAAGARVNLLPSYTGNSNKVLAVNAGETDVEWVVQSGGGGGTVDLSTTNATGILPVVKGGTGGTNKLTALIGLSVYGSQFTNGVDLSISPNFGTIADSSVRIGDSADARAEGTVAIGAQSEAENAFSTAIGRSARAQGTNNVALGYGARVTGSWAVQLGLGTNGATETIQFRNAGTVDTNEWAALANAGTIGTNLLRSTNEAVAQAAIFPATTTNAPTNTNAPTPDAWLDITVGTNAYKLPLWQ